MRGLVLLLLILALFPCSVFAEEYSLTLSKKMVTINGKQVEKLAINDSIPGPTLRFKEGEDVTIHVTNHLDEQSSIHWHGLLLDGLMDGVPGLNGFKGINPHETFTYHIKIRQSGTYWYHSHSLGQEQEGLYGAIVITPKKEPQPADRDYVVLLSDISPESPADIMQNLKMDSSYYNHSKRTIGDFISDVRTKSWDSAIQNRKEWGQMRMHPTDMSDVSGYTFLMNGNKPEENWTGLFTKGEKIRLRFINAAAMTFFDVRIPELKMTVVAADGQNIEPVNIDEFRFGIAETYDVIVEPKETKPYTIVAESIDRTGFALGTLAPKAGMKGTMPTHRPRALLTMADMNMPMMMQEMPDMDMSSEDAHVSGWAKAGTPEGHKALSYEDLRYLNTQPDIRQPVKEIEMRLGGSMERFIWTLNGKTMDDAEPIRVNYGDRIRFNFVNETMMAHPMHLHGMFVQLENGQPMAKMPNKHTIIVPPGSSASALLTANEAGEWSFHCHLLYHMLSGMMTTLIVDKTPAKGE
jgi:FtsP/CotA-like multicopper oxidase with cupredoxin domain